LEKRFLMYYGFSKDSKTCLVYAKDR